MKYFGIDRVQEPLGVIPSVAWKIDNSKKLRPKEIRISLDTVKIERDNFNQICSACDYNDLQIKERYIRMVNMRGKLQNPYTESGGLLCGTVEEVGPQWQGCPVEDGDRIICMTSMCSLPMKIESIESIDYIYGTMKCAGYAILFESAQIVKMPENSESIKPLMCALDEEGSLMDIRDLMAEMKPKTVAVIGSSLTDTMFYGYMARNYNHDNVRVATIMPRTLFDYRNEMPHIFEGIADKVYFADMMRPVEWSEKILQEEGGQPFDAVINLEDIKGSESLSALLVKNNGFLFHTAINRNYFQGLLATDCLGKEVKSYAFDGYTKGSFEFASELTENLRENIKRIERTFAHSRRNSRDLFSNRPENSELSVQKIGDFIYMSPITGELVANAVNVAQYDCNVIIQGETGVGKERILDIIHHNSPRRGKPCVKINCATIQENLAESEFFGYEKGSFTGAQPGGKAGYFEIANNGILFLDEIGSLPLAMQTKLLRVLQENSYYRVGGTEQKNVNVRVICANNVPLKKLVEDGRFREDLYYRLNICLIEVPPLRNRKEDIVCLAESFIAKYSEKYGVQKVFSKNALHKLENYHWPGNVRELENTVHRLYISEKSDIVEEEAVGKFLDDTVYEDMLIDIKGACANTPTVDFNTLMDEQEKRIIAYALNREKTTRRAAAFLNIPQPTLARKKVKYGL